MAARRGRWRAGPTDAQGDAAELRHTSAVGMPEHFKTPDVDTVLQAETETPGGETGMPDEPIPVRLTSPVNINQLPTTVGGLFSKGLAASPAAAVKVLNADPRRAAVHLSCDTNSVAIGRTQAEANDANAYVVSSGVGTFRFHFTEELWARSLAAASRLSICVEQWAR
jgi:hypothetical protein